MSYYWRECPSGGHIEQTSEKVVSILKAQGYKMNENQEADCEAQIEDLLERAEAGRLVPVEHVKRVQRAPAVDMFEIRWNHIGVTEVNRVSGMYAGVEVKVRLYYVEEGEPWVVGLLVHEKIIGSTDEETRQLQNEKIDAAIEHCRASSARRWGVQELAPPTSS